MGSGKEVKEPEQANWHDLMQAKLNPYFNGNYNEPVTLTAPEVRRLLQWVKRCRVAERRERRTFNMLAKVLADNDVHPEELERIGKELALDKED